MQHRVDFADAGRSTKPDLTAIRKALGTRSVVLVGLMGVGKSSIGRRLANRLGLRFSDADAEIERAAGKSILEIFDEHGEPYFRSGEARVIERLLGEGPQVLATGGGAFMHEPTREAIRANGFSVWLDADLEVLVRRVSRRTDRPLLRGRDPKEVLTELIAARNPVYALADIHVESRDVRHDLTVQEILRALDDRL